MPQCIYCRKHKILNDFSSREHVLPQSFGSFTPNNILLNDSLKRLKHVCNKCNNAFSKLELWFARDSFEGYILRSKFISRTSNESERQRLKIIVAEGEYKGLHMELESAGNVIPSPQISLQRKNGERDYFLLNEISSIKIENYDLKANSLKAYGLSIEDTEQTYKNLGINFDYQGECLLPISFNCAISSIIDRVIKRTISKIAFNFFAYYNYKYISLDPSFDPLRNYILKDKGNIPIQVTDEPILFDERVNGMGKVGYIIIMNCDRQGHIIIKVSPFNHITYTIRLSEQRYAKLKIGFGKFFDTYSKEIFDIKHTNIALVPLIVIPKKQLWLPPQ